MLDIRHFGKKGKIMAKKLTPEQIFEKLEELHDQENELLERLKEGVSFVTESGLEGTIIHKNEGSVLCLFTKTRDTDPADDSYYLGKQRVTLTMKVWVKDEQNVRNRLENKK